MLDFLHKDEVCTFVLTNGARVRNFEENVLVNGHPAIVTYAKPLAVMLGIVYKVWDPSSKSLKYVLNIGIGEQDVNDNVKPSEQELLEDAAVNARISPCISVTFDEMPETPLFEDLCTIYMNANKKYVRSIEEVHAVENGCSYGKKYPYDWLYFGKHFRLELNCGCGR